MIPFELLVTLVDAWPHTVGNYLSRSTEATVLTTIQLREKNSLNFYGKFKKKQEQLTFHIGHGSNIVFGRQHKLIVYDPVRFVVQTRGWMQLYNLVILDC